MDNLDFGLALHGLRAGVRMARANWNGKGMFVYLIPASSYPAQRGAAKAWAGEDAMIPYREYLAMRTVDGEIVPWTISQTDALASDWMEV